MRKDVSKQILLTFSLFIKFLAQSFITKVVDQMLRVSDLRMDLRTDKVNYRNFSAVWKYLEIMFQQTRWYIYQVRFIIICDTLRPLHWSVYATYYQLIMLSCQIFGIWPDIQNLQIHFISSLKSVNHWNRRQDIFVDTWNSMPYRSLQYSLMFGYTCSINTFRSSTMSVKVELVNTRTTCTKAVHTSNQGCGFSLHRSNPDPV